MRKTYIFIAILLICPILLSASVFQFIAPGSWTDIDNWENGIYPGLTTQVSDTIIINSNCSISDKLILNGYIHVTLGNSVTIDNEATFNKALLLEGNLTNNGTTTFNALTLVFGICNNAGIMELNSTMVVDLELINSSQFTILTGAKLENYATTDNLGDFVLQANATIKNFAEFTNSSQLTINGNLEMPSISSAILSNSGTIDLSGLATLEATTINDVSGEVFILIDGSMIIPDEATMSNLSNITVEGTLNISDQSINTLGDLIINDGGQVNYLTTIPQIIPQF